LFLIFATSMQAREIIGTKEFHLIIKRLAFQLIENHSDFKDTVLIGLQDRGIHLADKLGDVLREMKPDSEINVGHLDITFFRDDFRRSDKPLKANKTEINFVIENKNVILIDDVLFTGRTVRAGLDAMMAFGRPANVELLTFVDRRYTRHLPIEASYVGKTVDSIAKDKVLVEWTKLEGQDRVMMYSSEKE